MIRISAEETVHDRVDDEGGAIFILMKSLRTAAPRPARQQTAAGRFQRRGGAPKVRLFGWESQPLEEAAMCGKKAFVALAVTAALGILGAAPAVGGQDRPDRTEERGGAVAPCNLTGVNPAYHPEIFGNAATALAFGFVKSRDGTWQVAPNCHRWEYTKAPRRPFAWRRSHARAWSIGSDINRGFPVWWSLCVWLEKKPRRSKGRGLSIQTSWPLPATQLDMEISWSSGSTDHFDRCLLYPGA
jgi:hypothetical protein